MKEAGVEVLTDIDRKAFSVRWSSECAIYFLKDNPQGADLPQAVDEVQ